MILTKEQIEEIKKRAEAAPLYKFGPERIDHDDGSITYELNESGKLISFYERNFTEPMRAKFAAEFFFHARTDIPALIDSHEELWELIEILETRLAGARLRADKNADDCLVAEKNLREAREEIERLKKDVRDWEQEAREVRSSDGWDGYSPRTEDEER